MRDHLRMRADAEAEKARPPRPPREVKAAALLSLSKARKTGELERVIDTIEPPVPQRDRILGSDVLSASVASMRISRCEGSPAGYITSGEVVYVVEACLRSGVPVAVKKAYGDFETLHEEITTRLYGFDGAEAVDTLVFPAKTTLTFTSWAEQVPRSSCWP